MSKVCVLPKKNIHSVLGLCLLAIFVAPLSWAVDVRGRVSAENRFFTDDKQSQASIVIEPDAYWSWNNENDGLTFKPYYRHDSLDDERSHADIRQLYWLHVASDWELRVGIDKVFWGVTETQHLVDVINQTDAVESIDGEEKLGQPMVQLSLIRDWGILDIYALPYFRERTFPGDKGRLGGPLTVDADNTLYESSREEKHLDYAVRWGHYIGNWDIGLSYFKGTNRDPKFVLDPALMNPSLLPFYDQMQQFGLTVQATLGSWLWKLEAIRRSDSIERFAQATLGFEYSIVGLGETPYDLGVLMEYHSDSRHENSSALFQNDIFVGGRFTLNDIQSSELLFGVSADLDYSGSYNALIEGSRRLGESWKLSVNAAFLKSDDPADPGFNFSEEDHIELQLEYFF